MLFQALADHFGGLAGFEILVIADLHIFFFQSVLVLGLDGLLPHAHFRFLDTEHAVELHNGQFFLCQLLIFRRKGRIYFCIDGTALHLQSGFQPLDFQFFFCQLFLEFFLCPHLGQFHGFFQALFKLGGFPLQLLPAADILPVLILGNFPLKFLIPDLKHDFGICGILNFKGLPAPGTYDFLHGHFLFSACVFLIITQNLRQCK